MFKHPVSIMTFLVLSLLGFSAAAVTAQELPSGNGWAVLVGVSVPLKKNCRPARGKGKDMKNIRKVAIVCLVVCFTSIGVYLYLDYQFEQTRIATKELTQKILDMYQSEIETAQKSGDLGLYDPMLTSQMELADIFELLEYKGGIKRMTFHGSPQHVFDKKIIGMIATMPDIKILEIHRTRLSDGLFESLNQSTGIHTLDLRKCFAGPKAYDLSLAKSVKRLSILAPIEYGHDGFPTTMSPQKLLETIHFLCQCQHLDYLLLDRVFIEWENDLQNHLPNTEIQFGILDSYDGKLILDTPLPLQGGNNIKRAYITQGVALGCYA